MNSPLLQDGTAVAMQYMHQATTLRQELLRAIDSIASNSLPDFEQSLWQQEMLSTGMRRSLHLLRNLHLRPSQLAELQLANESLQQVSRVYQGVIGQSSQSAALLRGVCTLYGHAPSSALNHQQSLSYEA